MHVETHKKESQQFNSLVLDELDILSTFETSEEIADSDTVAGADTEVGPEKEACSADVVENFSNLGLRTSNDMFDGTQSLALSRTAAGLLSCPSVTAACCSSVAAAGCSSVDSTSTEKLFKVSNHLFLSVWWSVFHRSTFLPIQHLRFDPLLPWSSGRLSHSSRSACFT